MLTFATNAPPAALLTDSFGWALVRVAGLVAEFDASG